MALAIDTTTLAEHCMPKVQGDLDRLVGNSVKRFQVQRLSAHATVIHDVAFTARRRLSEAGGDLQVAKQEALDWQADQDKDLDEPEVFRHLREQASKSPLFDAVFSQNDFSTTTLVASCAWAMSPALAVRARNRSLSSFHRYSLRSSFLAVYDGHSFPHFCGAGSGDPNVIPDYPIKYDEWVASMSSLKIVGAKENLCVVWHLQCDVVDLCSPKAQGLGWRQRTAEVPSLQLSSAPVEEDTSREKRFNGVRYRKNRRAWIAEMKTPKSKNKVSFGDFKFAAHAARVVDAAFYYYNRLDLLNFADSPRILSQRPSPPPTLNEDDKLRFVKEEAKWLASIASTLTSSLPSESDNVIADPFSPARRLGSSSVRITEGWDGADHSSPVLSNFVNPSQPCESQTTWMNSFVMSPALPTIPVPPSPRNFQDEVARGLLEQQ